MKHPRNDIIYKGEIKMSKQVMLVEPDKESKVYMEDAITREGFCVKSFDNGADAIDYYMKNEVHIVITEMFMSGIDGISMVRMLKDPTRNQENTIFIVISPISEGDMVNYIMGYADYYMVTPISSVSLKYSLKFAINKKRRNKRVINMNHEDHVLAILKEIGIPYKLNGYSYLVDAITMIVNTKGMDIKVCKEVYPVIAEKYNVSAYSVERCIRSAIEIGFNRGNVKYLDELFGYTVEKRKGKPTNTEFLFGVADYIKRGIK